MGWRDLFSSAKAEDDGNQRDGSLRLDPALTIYTILVIGESGVGKSTWLNAILNYLTYATLDDALNATELLHLIPACFIATDRKTFEEKSIYVGKESDYEKFQAGQAGTRFPRSYIFRVGNFYLRIIDTPGIGDARGTAVDKTNMGNIISFISQFDTIHGIAILLPPDACKLSTGFKFCLNELLVRLHKDATPNIVFVFTKSLMNFYAPGATLSTLRLYLNALKARTNITIALNPKTVFCMDNIAFVYLCLHKNGLSGSPKEVEEYSASWRISRDSTFALIEYIIGLKPHAPKLTEALNKAKTMILNCAPAMVINVKMLKVNEMALTEDLARMNRTNKKNADWFKQLYKTVHFIEKQDLSHPRTVCAAESCTQWKRGEGGENLLPVYAICHAHCYLKDVPEECLGGKDALRQCQTITNDYCEQASCGHSYMEHKMSQHIKYEIVEGSKEETDPQAEKEYEDGLDEETIIQNAIDRVKLEIAERHKEVKTISETSACFGSMYIEGATLDQNDVYEERLLEELEIETLKATKGSRNREKIEAIKVAIEEYKAECALLADSLQRRGKKDLKLDPAEVERRYQVLINLKYSGQKIKELVEAEKKARREAEKKMAEPEKLVSGSYSMAQTAPHSSGQASKPGPSAGERPVAKGAQLNGGTRGDASTGNAYAGVMGQPNVGEHGGTSTAMIQAAMPGQLNGLRAAARKLFTQAEHYEQKAGNEKALMLTAAKGGKRAVAHNHSTGSQDLQDAAMKCLKLATKLNAWSNPLENCIPAIVKAVCQAMESGSLVELESMVARLEQVYPILSETGGSGNNGMGDSELINSLHQLALP